MSKLTDAIDHNVSDVLENGPRLSYNRKTAIVAYDPVKKRVLKGGLGAIGVGEMWMDMKDEDMAEIEAESVPQKNAPDSGMSFKESELFHEGLRELSRKYGPKETP